MQMPKNRLYLLQWGNDFVSFELQVPNWWKSEVLARPPSYTVKHRSNVATKKRRRPPSSRSIPKVPSDHDPYYRLHLLTSKYLWVNTFALATKERILGLWLLMVVVTWYACIIWLSKQLSIPIALPPYNLYPSRHSKPLIIFSINDLVTCLSHPFYRYSFLILIIK